MEKGGHRHAQTLPSPQSHLCLLPASAEASILMEISLETFPWGKEPRKCTCAHTYTHTLLSMRCEKMKEENATHCICQNCGEIYQPLRTCLSPRNSRLRSIAEPPDRAGLLLAPGSPIPSLLWRYISALAIVPRFS